MIGFMQFQKIGLRNILVCLQVRGHQQDTPNIEMSLAKKKSERKLGHFTPDNNNIREAVMLEVGRHIV